MQTHLDRTATMLAAQAGDFAELSRAYAARGDARRAVLAAWSADVRTVQQLLWQTRVATSEDPEQELRSVFVSVDSALTSYAGQDPSYRSLRHVVETGRQALLSVVDAPHRAALEDRLSSLDHLDALSPHQAGQANAAVMDRLGARSGEQLVGDLLTARSDCRIVAGVMADLGDVEEAERQTAAADLAGFEAYLVLSSAASGDATLATADLRWDVAASAALRREHGGPDVAATQRDAILASVLPAERDALLAVLDLPVSVGSVRV